ncbi:hypothetical protein Tco_0089585 [Tanacetum coccineum]
MDNPNLTMEEYIRLEEENARKRGKVFNWQTATYGKIRVDDNFYDLRSMEAEFPAIVVNDDSAPKDTLQCKSQVSVPINDKIDFRISFDESDDEDYTIICDKNSFFYKMISVNNLKTDSENDYEKVMPSIPSPEPMELVEKFFCRFYPESYDGEDEMLDEGENWGIDPLEFLSNINTSFKYHKKVDVRTQKVIFHAWMNGNWNKTYVDNSILSNNELKESKYENPSNTATDSFFKAYEVRDIEKQSQTKRKYSNTSNSIKELPNKRRCKAEKFEAIQYSLRPNEEYIAIRSYEYDI